MKREQRWFFLIETEHLNKAARGCGVEGVLDMLRYDHAVVENNRPGGFWLFSSEREPTHKRWLSFGIRIAAVTRAPGEVTDIAKALKEKEALARTVLPG
jgi:hypothetical protein